MITLMILGIVLIIIGGMMLFAPEALFKISNYMNKAIFDDTTIHEHRVIMAIITLLVGVLLLFIYLVYGK